MLAVFSFCLLLSATLVFWVQPFFGKMVLPLLGGTSAVWNTCLVFFQAALLLGYLYAHAHSTFFRLRVQFVIHLVLFVGVFALLPLALPAGWTPPVDTNPVPWLLLVLCVSVGLPFVMLSATAPLLQSWYSHSGRPDAGDPYFLYAASNAGSLLGLLGYPVVLERMFTLGEQSWAWGAGYALLFSCILAGVAMLWPRTAGIVHATRDEDSLPEKLPRVRWLLLSAVPSSLLQSVSTYLTTDLAAVPLLWVMPLAIYLLTFVLVFSRRKLIPHATMVNVQPYLLVATVALVFFWEQDNFWWLLFANVAVLFVTAMVCHGELVNLRPSTEHLTEFYLWMATGGVLGGIFNALVAPLIFNSLMEYPIALVLAAFLRPAGDDRGPATIKSRVLDVLLPASLGVILGATVWAAQKYYLYLYEPAERGAFAYVVGVAACIIFRGRPIRLGVALAAILGAGLFLTHLDDAGSMETMHRTRNFFGMLKVLRNHGQGEMQLVHGHILHGTQRIDPDVRDEPTSYFHSLGPLGGIFEGLPPLERERRVAVIGLGAGTMAAYAKPGDHWVFYELNPAVLEIARDVRYFSFLVDCKGKLDVVLGDARLSLVKARDHYYDVLAIDAFSSDSIPVHLLTKEAIQLYLSKIGTHGVIVFHISNRYLRLNRVLFKHSEEFGLVGVRSRLTLEDGKDAWPDAPMSDWAVIARKSDDLGALVNDARWKKLISAIPVKRAWTDDYSNILEFLAIPGLSGEK